MLQAVHALRSASLTPHIQESDLTVYEFAPNPRKALPPRNLLLAVNSSSVYASAPVRHFPSTIIRLLVWCSCGSSVSGWYNPLWSSHRTASPYLLLILLRSFDPKGRTALSFPMRHLSAEQRRDHAALERHSRQRGVLPLGSERGRIDDPLGPGVDDRNVCR